MVFNDILIYGLQILILLLPRFTFDREANPPLYYLDRLPLPQGEREENPV